MPQYMNPKIGDCSSYNSLDCAPSYRHGELLADEEDYVRPEVRPEDDEDYIQALERYEDHMRRMAESVTIYEGLYWRRLWKRIKDFANEQAGWHSAKFLVVGKELAACLFSGGILLGTVIILLTLFGSMKIQNLGNLLVAYVIGTLYVTESIEMAASSIIGLTLLLFLFFTRVTTGQRILTVKNRGRDNKLCEDDTHVFIDFWYCGSRCVWINLSKKTVGIL